MRQRLLSLLAVVTLSLFSLPLVTLAGGWFIVSLDTLPQEIWPGEEILVGFTVLQHGRHPVLGLKPAVKLVHPASGESRTITAMPDKQAGHYSVWVAFTQPGVWEWAITAFEGDHPMPSLTVHAQLPATPAPSLAGQPAEGPVTAAASAVGTGSGANLLPAPWRWPVLLGGVALIALGGVMMWTAWRPRRITGAAVTA